VTGRLSEHHRFGFHHQRHGASRMELVRFIRKHFVHLGGAWGPTRDHEQYPDAHVPLLNDIKFKGGLNVSWTDQYGDVCSIYSHLPSLYMFLTLFIYLRRPLSMGFSTGVHFKGEPQIGLHDPAGQNVEIKWSERSSLN